MLEYMETIDRTMSEAEMLLRAMRIIEVDIQTACPKKGVAHSGQAATMLEKQVFRLKTSPEFTEAVKAMYACRDELGECDRALAEQLMCDICHDAGMTAAQKEENSLDKHRAWIAWTEAREQNDFSVFAGALEKLIESEKRRVMSWKPLSDSEKDMSVYQRMLTEFERGIREDTIDRLFTQARDAITGLLGRIKGSGRVIRTDFLRRTVPLAKQRELSEYLLRLMGFDFDGGMISESEHPFTELIGKGDVRVTTHYYEDSFLSNFYSVLHEGGHALFEQMTPDEDFARFIADRKTMGMHESVSRFYENIIGRSRPFIHFIYPKLREMLPEVFSDVTEQEFYEAVNCVEPSLIRMDADELTYTLHIIIRYEIEKELTDGSIAVGDIPAVWKAKYEQYLGVAPENDNEGALQDSHWASDFGYFPTYALGNFYGAMYAEKMREDIDVDAALENGDFTQINEWMRVYVFAKADRTDSEEWIKNITGRELTADDFIAYLNDKYSAIYDIK